MQKLSDTQLRDKTAEFKKRLKNGEKLDDLLVEAFAARHRSTFVFLRFARATSKEKSIHMQLHL